MYRKKPMSFRLPIILQIKVNFHFIFLGVFGSLISGLLLNLFDIHQVGIISSPNVYDKNIPINLKAAFSRTSFT